MSSGCYVYAIVRRDAPVPPPGSGDAVADLAKISWRDLAAVTAPATDAEAAEPTMDAVMHHERIIEAVRRLGPALPVRFGTVFSDARLVTSALEERYETLAADLDRLGDKVELGLTAFWADPAFAEWLASARADASDDAGAGARYLYARADAFRREDAMLARARVAARYLEGVLGARVIEQRVSLLPTPRVALRASYLLDPAAVAAFRATFDTIRRGLRDVRLLLTGPWPPYSFVTRSETRARPDELEPRERALVFSRAAQVSH